MTQQTQQILPSPIVVPREGEDIDALLAKEWLLTNRIGAYASSTPVGCNTRRYHGLLVAATQPPVGRIMALTSVMEELVVGGTRYELATNAFADAYSPLGLQHLVEFRNDVTATFIFRCGETELTKQVVLADATNAVAIRYSLTGPDATLHVRPFTALRDYHHLRDESHPHQMTFEKVHGGAIVQDRLQARFALQVISAEAHFDARPQWWYRFCYRADLARGQEGYEDLYTPGSFTYALSDGQSCQMTASLDEPTPVGFNTTVERKRDRLETIVTGLGNDADETTRRLAIATDAFVARRSSPNAPDSPTILAGYPWFADWGRDAFIALPGLLLATRRFDLARQVFQTFAGAVSEGMIPNRFDDYSSTAHYNSIDASLWFILAGERYVEATGDSRFWRGTLMPAAAAILKAYHDGTRFGIRADDDGLLAGGSHDTQLTWMDAKLGDEVVTPRHGRAVEVNALWYNAHRILAERCRGIDNELAERSADQAQLIAPAFVRTFWNDVGQCLYDCVTDGYGDESIRPNQIFAVSLPYSPLSAEQQAAVVRTVQQKLLTPMGLRTLSPDDSRYRRRYGGSWESRDRAYHQGTVWAWLIGPFVEAYLKVENYKPFALSQAQQWLDAFDGHLAEAGLGYISEIFDGDAPHAPRGCIAQAWSVAEVLRARQFVRSHQLAAGEVG